MNTKCLVTYLEGKADNTSLLKINEGRLKFKRSKYADGITGINLRFNANGQTLTIIGEGNFTDASGVIIGKTTTVQGFTNIVVYVDSNVREISIPNKHLVHWIGYTTGSFTFVLGQTTNPKSAVVPDMNLREVKWYTDLRRLAIANSTMSGSFSDLLQMANITYIDVRSCPIKGNLSELTGKQLLQSLIITSTPIVGDIADLPNSLQGDFSFRVCHGIYGDLGSCPIGVRFMSNSSGESKFTYSSNKKNRTDILFLQDITITSGADKYLIDMATLNFNPVNTTTAYYSQIKIKANVTSASDNAIIELQNKGVSVIIIPL